MNNLENENLIYASVLICTYNQETTIAQTIESILSQECDFKFEIIIGEDCSQDNTYSICEEYKNKYPENIKILSHEKNLGFVENWLSCIKSASGKYIMACGGDDYWHNNKKIQLQIDYLESNLNCGVLHTDYDLLDCNTNKIKTITQNGNVLQGRCQKSIFNGTLKICAPTACVRKSLFDKYVPVEKYIKYNFPIEDWPTWIILSYYSDINYLPISTVTYRRGHESLSNLKSFDKMITKYNREKIMYKIICELFPEDLIFNEKDYDNYVNSILLRLAFTNMDFQKAKFYGKKENYLPFKSFLSGNRFLFYTYCNFKRIVLCFQ